MSWERGHSEDDDSITNIKRQLRDRAYKAQLKEYDEWEKDIDDPTARSKTLRLRGEHDKAQQVEQQLAELRRNNPAAQGRRDQALLWGARSRGDDQ